MLLEEFDSNQEAIINPWDVMDEIPDFPKTVVTCFARTTFDRMVKAFHGELLAETSMANLSIPIYQIHVNGKRLAVYNSPVGASACIAIIEDLWAMGARSFLVFGTCGVLKQDIAATSVIVPTNAFRDEGTSYHYAPASDEIALNQELQNWLTQSLEEKGISYVAGKVWTTDGIYRETRDKMRARMEAGAICVDMEASALAAWAQFRQVQLAQFFYAADHLSDEAWDARSLADDADLEKKDKIAALAIGLAVEIESKYEKDHY